DFVKTQAYKAGIVKQLVSGVTSLLAASKIAVVRGEASFSAPNDLLVRGPEGQKSFKFDKIIIASGSQPAIPPIPGADGPHCVDSAGALDLQAEPKSLVIIGGGVIGMEIATIYAALGSKVHIVEMLPEILPSMDADLIKFVKTDLERKYVEILTGARVVSIRDKGIFASVEVETREGKKELSGEKVLLAVGRKPSTASLNLDAVGIRHDRGRIIVNERMESSLPGVYAVGDCNGLIMLAHAASMQGEVAAENAMGRQALFNGATNPSCVYTFPELAGVGLTEAEAKKRNLDYLVGRFPLQANGKALIMNGGKGLVKIIAGKRFKEILGVHIAGPRATDLIAEAALAIGTELTVDEFINTIHGHPTLSEAVREAALALDKRALHIPNR
ncbi:NAD(P)/FAD-dependent oxidoreductase, partial [Desulfovibrio sp. OttesenSCG-928-C14]|nr:NAD(P)/FAD-dependent oxidoreductase [Desulfovibrio sp. OttesenSCG-928-C14]